MGLIAIMRKDMNTIGVSPLHDYCEITAEARKHDHEWTPMLGNAG